jgi:hypothetical protein
MNIEVEKEVMEYIKKTKKDFRVCTSCLGPALVPINLSKPKDTDLKVKIGKNMLFISAVQAKYIDRVNIDMIDNINCKLFKNRR